MDMILGAETFKTNADLIRACISLGYINAGESVLDPTYGKGTWWKGTHIEEMCEFTKHDLKLDGVDFRRLPHDNGTFDVAVFDPPYVAVGGRNTSTIGDFNEAYGLDHVPRTVEGLHQLMVDGLHELWHVLKPKGIVLFKCMNYVSGGKYRAQGYDALNAVTPRFRLRDEFIHLRKPGPQPEHARQLHARRNYSHLFVLESKKR